jgi:hypothetical protein
MLLCRKSLNNKDKNTETKCWCNIMFYVALQEVTFVENTDGNTETKVLTWSIFYRNIYTHLHTYIGILPGLAKHTCRHCHCKDVCMYACCCDHKELLMRRYVLLFQTWRKHSRLKNWRSLLCSSILIFTMIVIFLGKKENIFLPNAANQFFFF